MYLPLKKNQIIKLNNKFIYYFKMFNPITLIFKANHLEKEYW